VYHCFKNTYLSSYWSSSQQSVGCSESVDVLKLNGNQHKVEMEQVYLSSLSFAPNSRNFLMFNL
jgi:hypothetical protein